MLKINFSALFLAILFLISGANAQTDSTKYGWSHTMVSSLNLTQVSFTNWVGGGDNSLAYNAGIDGKSVDDEVRTNWTTNYKFSFGQAELSDKGIRKTDDNIDVQSLLTYKLGVYVNPYASIAMKSQFTTGYKYNNDSANTKTAVSDLFDPAYLVEAVGLGYQPLKQFKTRLGLALKETFTRDHTIYSDDPKTAAVEKSKIEGGMEWVSEAEIPVDDNVLFKSKLEVFAPFKTFTVMTMRWDNLVIAKVSKYINVNVGLLAINDPVVSKRTQIKEGISLGLTYSVF